MMTTIPSEYRAPYLVLDYRDGRWRCRVIHHTAKSRFLSGELDITAPYALNMSTICVRLGWTRAGAIRKGRRELRRYVAFVAAEAVPPVEIR